MPSFADSIFLFVLALLLFGPKKLPVLARELGKWVGEFRRASNEFKFQMEEELRASEQADRQKQIAAMEAAAPLPPPLEPEPEHPHLRSQVVSSAEASDTSAESAAEPTIAPPSRNLTGTTPASATEATNPSLEKVEGVRPVPIATSGDLHMMPPATGLPTPRPRNLSAAEPKAEADPLAGMLGSIPEAAPERHTHSHPDRLPEPVTHGD